MASCLAIEIRGNIARGRILSTDHPTQTMRDKIALHEKARLRSMPRRSNRLLCKAGQDHKESYCRIITRSESAFSPDVFPFCDRKSVKLPLLRNWWCGCTVRYSWMMHALKIAKPNHG